MQTELLQKDLKTVGEAIRHELGAQMITDYQTANPADVKGYFVGSDIITKILAQPGCVGIRLFNAYNEEGKKTLVYVGVDAAGKNIVKSTVVTIKGDLATDEGIVADRNDTWADWFLGWLY